MSVHVEAPVQVPVTVAFATDIDGVSTPAWSSDSYGHPETVDLEIEWPTIVVGAFDFWLDSAAFPQELSDHPYC